jgi:hypothetical protein
MNKILYFSLAGILVFSVSLMAEERDSSKLNNSIIVITSDPDAVKGGRMIQLDPHKPGDVNAMQNIKNGSPWVLIEKNDLTPPENRSKDLPKNKMDVKQDPNEDKGNNPEQPKVEKTWVKDDSPSPSWQLPAGNRYDSPLDYRSIYNQGMVSPRPKK